MPVSAASSNFYVTGAVGRSSIDADAASINTVARNTVGAAATSVSTNDVGWKLQLGYRISTSLALEGGYTNLGKSKYITATPVYTAGGAKQADLFNLDLVGTMELAKSFSLLARIGGYRWQTKSDLPFAAGMRSVTEHSFDFKAGIGLQYDFNQNFALRAEFERFNGVGKQATSGDSKVNLYSIGAVLMF
jgi:OOP family OmpA-OmpF porin